MPASEKSPFETLLNRAYNAISDAAAIREHREIVRAMRERNAEHAAFLMGRHIREERCHLLRLQGVTPLARELQLDNQTAAALRGRKKAPRTGSTVGGD